jgi:hypothetical protein
VDLSSDDEPETAALDVVGTPQGGALVLMGGPPPGPVRRLVTVSGEGERTNSVAVPGLATAWNLHVLPDGTAVVTGQLAGENTLGFVAVDVSTGAALRVPALPLDDATTRVEGDSALSPDGRTVWLFSSTLVDGTFGYLVTGHDVTTGAIVRSRDLFAELRGIHVPHQDLDVVGVAAPAGGGVVLAVNIFPPGASSYWTPTMLTYDAALEPVTRPLTLASREAAEPATALAMAADGTAFVLLRGPQMHTLVAVPPGAHAPERRVAMAGFGLTDELALDHEGRAVLPGRTGARRIDLASGAITDIDVGCPGAVTVRALSSSPAGTWVLGGCFEESTPPAMLWKIPAPS